MTTTPETKPWTVISIVDDFQEVLADHVLAEDEWAAFSAARALREDMLDVISFVGTVPGHVQVATPTESGVTCAAMDYPE